MKKSVKKPATKKPVLPKKTAQKKPVRKAPNLGWDTKTTWTPDAFDPMNLE